MKVVSTRAELNVLRGICHTDKAIAGTILGGVDADYFYSEEACEIYECTMRNFREYGEPPSFRVLMHDPELSREAKEYFKESSQVIRTMADAKKAVRILNKYRQTRGMYNLAAYINDNMQGSKVDIDAMLEYCSSAFSNIRASKQRNCFQHFGVSNNSRADINDLLYGDLSEDVIPTGIPAFDNEASGFLRGSLVTIGATSGGGKSLLALVMAMNQAGMGYKVAFVPLEMSKRELNARMLARLANLDVSRVLTQRITEAEKSFANERYEKWVRYCKRKNGRLTIFKPDSDLTLEEVYASLMSYDLDITYVDYIGLLAGMDGDDQWRKLGSSARYAKVNAENMHRVNVLLCQVGEDLHIRYSQAISEHSTNSMIWRAPLEEREAEVGDIEINQPKARNNKCQRFRVGFHWSTMRVVKASKEIPDAVDVSPKKRKNMIVPDV